MITKQRPLNKQEKADPLAKRETLEFVRAYYKIKDPAVRKRVFELTKAVSKAVGNVKNNTPELLATV